jgi:hypothetical protein
MKRSREKHILRNLIRGKYEQSTNELSTYEPTGIRQIDRNLRRRSNTNRDKQPVLVRSAIGSTCMVEYLRRPSFRKSPEWKQKKFTNRQLRAFRTILQLFEKGTPA